MKRGDNYTDKRVMNKQVERRKEKRETQEKMKERTG